MSRGRSWERQKDEALPHAGMDKKQILTRQFSWDGGHQKPNLTQRRGSSEQTRF